MAAKPPGPSADTMGGEAALDGEYAFTLRFAAGHRGRPPHVMAVNGVDRAAMDTVVDPYLDHLLCRP